MWIIFKLQKFSLRVLPSICLVFCQFQPGFTYKSVAYIRERIYIYIYIYLHSWCIVNIAIRVNLTSPFALALWKAMLDCAIRLLRLGWSFSIKELTICSGWLLLQEFPSPVLIGLWVRLWPLLKLIKTFRSFSKFSVSRCKLVADYYREIDCK